MGRDPFPLLQHVGVVAQGGELLPKRRRGPVLADPDRGQWIDPLRGVMLQRQVAGLLEKDVDDDSLGWGEDNRVNELLALHVAAVGADELIRAPGSTTLKTRVLAVLVR